MLAAWRARQGFASPASASASWTWRRALDAFLERVGETASVETVGCYRGPLERLFTSWDDTPPSAWTSPMFRLWVAAHPKWKPRTKHLLTHAGRRFLTWARKEGWPVADFVGDFRPPKIIATAPETLAPADFTAFVQASEGWDGEV